MVYGKTLPPPDSAHSPLRVLIYLQLGTRWTNDETGALCLPSSNNRGRSGCVFIFSIHPHHPCWFHSRALPTDYSKFRCILIPFPLPFQTMQRADTPSESLFWTGKVTTEHMPRRCVVSECDNKKVPLWRWFLYQKRSQLRSFALRTHSEKEEKKKCMQDKNQIFVWDSGKKQDIINSV